MSSELQWTDDTWKKGQMSAFFSYWVGWAAIFIAGYILFLCVKSFFDNNSFDGYMFIGDLLVTTLFFVTGVIAITMGNNLINRVKSITVNSNSIQITFWWQRKRNDITFSVDEIENIKLLDNKQSFYQMLVTLPREPICYEICVRGQSPFIITNRDAKLHEVVKKLASGGGVEIV